MKESETVLCGQWGAVSHLGEGADVTTASNSSHAGITRHTLSRMCWGHTHSRTGWWKRPHSGSHWCEPTLQATPKKRGPLCHYWNPSSPPTTPRPLQVPQANCTEASDSGIHREFGVCRVWKLKLLSFRLVSTLQEHEVCAWAGGWTTLAFGLLGLSGLGEDLSLHWGWEPWECVLC